jgi:hypothetical protein
MEDIIFKLFVSRDGILDMESQLINALENIGVSPSGIQQRGDYLEVWFQDPGEEKTSEINNLRFKHGDSDITIGLLRNVQQTISINFNGFDPLMKPRKLADIIADNGVVVNYYRQQKRVGRKSYLNGTHTFWVRSPQKTFTKKLGDTERCFFNQKKLNSMLPAVRTKPQAPAVPTPVQPAEPPQETQPIAQPPAVLPQEAPPITPRKLPTPPPPTAPPAIFTPPPQIAPPAVSVPQPEVYKALTGTATKKIKSFQSKLRHMLMIQHEAPTKEAAVYAWKHCGPDESTMLGKYIQLWSTHAKTIEHTIPGFPLDFYTFPTTPEQTKCKRQSWKQR